MAYIFKKKLRPKLDFLPAKVKVDLWGEVMLDYFNPETDFDTCHRLLNHEIEDGRSYPFTEPFNREEFEQYFLSDDAFVLKDAEQNILGIFYVKPNFPGPCSHICNGGFITHPEHRRKNIGRTMGSHFQYVARSLGYEASMFNLVFKDNPASIALWKSLGFEVLGTIPKAKKTKNGVYVDAVQFYLDFKSDAEKPDILLS